MLDFYTAVTFRSIPTFTDKGFLGCRRG